MAKEIERKFLVTDDCFKERAVFVKHIMQGYLSLDPERTVRVRLADEDDGTSRAYITIKGKNNGAERDEFEYEIPWDDGKAIYDMCVARVKKVRHMVPYDSLMWEVDVFQGVLEGLVVAEVEIDRSDRKFAMPSFIGREVTDDPRYYNSVLATLSSPPSR